MAIHRLEIEVAEGLIDALAVQTLHRLETWLSLRPSQLRTRRVVHLDLGLSDEEAARIREALVDPVAEVGALGMLPDGGAGLDLRRYSFGVDSPAEALAEVLTAYGASLTLGRAGEGGLEVRVRLPA